MLANLPDLQQLVACEIDPVVRKVRNHRVKNPKPRIPNPTPRSFCLTLNAAQAAEEHFLATCASDPRLTIVGDGLEYARNAGEEGFDLVLVDASEPVVEGDGGGDKGVFAPPRSVSKAFASTFGAVWQETSLRSSARTELDSDCVCVCVCVCRVMRNGDGLSALCNVLAPDGVMGINV